MKRRLLPLLSLIGLMTLIAACQPTADPAPRLVITPFPTATPGRVIVGDILIVDEAALRDAGLLSPATVVAIAALPTPTPDLFTCPVPAGTARLERTPPTNDPILIEEIVRFLNAGGDAGTLGDTLRDQWGVLPDGGLIRADVDFTGEGVPEILLVYQNPSATFTLLILGCVAGEYRVLYEFTTQTDAPPQIIAVGDMNRDFLNDLLFAVQQCPLDNTGAVIADSCEYRTRLITWRGDAGRFVNLLNAEVLSARPPTIADIDDDEVSEIIVRLESVGTRETGPLRTGVHIYDWNGEEYLLSIVQLDPPRFQIQVIHEADRLVQRRNLVEALALYEQALAGEGLRAWLPDERDALRAYTLYRLLITQVASQNPGQSNTYGLILSAYPEPENAPIYIRMALAFYESYQTSANPTTACDAVRALLSRTPGNNAVSLLNRYGTRNPTYTPADLCPF